jgi:hypothetical protein
MAIDKYKLVKGRFINISPFIYKAVESDSIDYDIVVSESGKRLDHYAQEYYSDANNWWVIAAASGIGWWLQVPEGVVLRIPTDLAQIIELKGEIV